VALTLANIKTLVQRYGFDTSDPLTDMINAAMFEAMEFYDWGWLYNRVTNVSMGPADSSVQNLPGDLFKIASLRDTTHGMKLEEMSPVEWDRVVDDPTSRGQPCRYAVIASNLFVWPMASEATAFDLVYQRRVAAMSADADEPASGLMPDRLRYALAYGAAAKLLQMENEEDRATSAEAEFQAALEAAAEHDSSSLEAYRTVVDSQGYGSW
jgi:hypothetical protein